MAPNVPDHSHTPEEERRNREAALDNTIEASFPASDPPSTDPNPDDDEAVAPKPPDADA
jgi:hypothetical protein